MLKLRIGFFLHQHKHSIGPVASIIRTQNLSSSCLKTGASLFANRLKPSSSVLITTRTFWETFPSPVRTFHAKDDLDKDNYELVYRNKLFNHAFYGQLVSELTLAVQTGYALYRGMNYFFAGEIAPAVTQLGSFTVTYDLLTLGILALFTIQNAFVFMAAQKVLLRIYHKKDTDEYMFVSLSVNPFTTRKLICKPGKLKCLHITGLIGIILGNFETEDQKYFLRHEHFKTNYHYNRLVYGDY